MRDYIIATDADSELLLSYVLEKGLPVFPMPLTLDDVEYNYDLGLTVQIPDFFEKIANGASFSSSCKSPWELKQWFEGLLKTSKNILYIGLSNQLSKHFENCVMAAKEDVYKRQDKGNPGVRDQMLSPAIWAKGTLRFGGSPSQRLGRTTC